MARPATRQPAAYPHRSAPRWPVAGWLSVALLLLAAGWSPAAVTSYTNAATYAAALSWAETSIDFESLARNTVITNQYSSQGVSFSAGAYGGGSPLIGEAADLDGSTPRDVRALRAPGIMVTDPVTFGVRLEFADPVASFGGYHLDVSATLYVTLLNATGGTLAALTFAGGGETGATARFFGAISDTRDIKAVELRTEAAPPNGDFFALDDLQFSAPPQPASVAVYDNWIGFGTLNPTQGTAASPAKVIANATPASSWGATATIPAVANYDVGYLQINAPSRLRLQLSFSGHLKRCTPTGQAFAGVDTRKQTPGSYELATQWKVNLYGRYLTTAVARYSSPTSGVQTDYDAWSGWSTGGNDPVSDGGWLWPSTTDAWTGGAVSGYATQTGLDLLVERGQYTASGLHDPAGLCVIERTLRRGQQDVAGNYRQDVSILLTYAE